MTPFWYHLIVICWHLIHRCTLMLCRFGSSENPFQFFWSAPGIPQSLLHTLEFHQNYDGRHPNMQVATPLSTDFYDQMHYDQYIPETHRTANFSIWRQNQCNVVSPLPRSLDAANILAYHFSPNRNSSLILAKLEEKGISCF